MMKLEDSQRLENEVNTLGYISRYLYTYYRVSIPEEMRQRCNRASARCLEMANLVRLRNHMDTAQQNIKDLMKCRREKNWDEMYNCLETLQGTVKNVKSYSNFSSQEPQFLWYTQKEWVTQLLEHAFMCFETCVESAKRCSICMEIQENNADCDIIFCHEPKFDVASYSEHRRVMPCMSCRSCFDKFLKHSSALGKPTLKCPGMHCPIQLDEKRVEKISPVGIEEYRLALLKYKLKQCENFKFCPNADCGHGFQIQMSCVKVDGISCPHCTTKFCPGCNGDPHPGKTCVENQKFLHEQVWGALENEVFMQRESKQCPFCLVWIEKNEGCDHMTCHHCRGEFCWNCFGNWRSHTSCERPVKVVRKEFKEIMRYVHWPTGKDSVKHRRHMAIENQYHSNLAYQSFNQGWYTSDELDEDDEILLVKANPEYTEGEIPEVDNWELDIYGDDWDDSDVEFDFEIGTTIYVIPDNNRTIRKCKIAEHNDLGQVRVVFDGRYSPDEWIDKNSNRLYEKLPKGWIVGHFITPEQEEAARNPVAEPEPEPTRDPPIQQVQEVVTPEVQELVTPPEVQELVTPQTDETTDGAEVGEKQSESNTGGAALDTDDQKDVELVEADGDVLPEDVKIEPEPTPMYIYEWVKKPVVYKEDVITQLNYFAWILGFEIEEKETVSVEENPSAGTSPQNSPAAGDVKEDVEVVEVF